MNKTKRYHTRQKDIILNFFKTHADECFCAKDIINNDALPLGEATVYRYLSKFTKENKLKKFISDNRGGAFYQYSDNDICANCHIHLKCLSCGQLVHLNCSFMMQIENHMKEIHNFSLDNSKTVIYGLCEHCK